MQFCCQRLKRFVWQEFKLECSKAGHLASMCKVNKLLHVSCKVRIWDFFKLRKQANLESNLSSSQLLLMSLRVSERTSINPQ
eukprot:2329945-Amphidinium_carterae.1